MNNVRMSEIVNSILRALLALFIAICFYFLAACAAPATTIEYKIIEVPVVCDVEPPQRPISLSGGGEIVLKLVDLLEYVELLENAFRACKGETE
jgi:hypothetical protein